VRSPLPGATFYTEQHGASDDRVRVLLPEHLPCSYLRGSADEFFEAVLLSARAFV